MEIKNLKTAKKTDLWRVCVYGKPGAGKTTLVKNLSGKTLVLALDNSTKVLAGLDVDVIEFDRVHPIEQASEFATQILPTVANDYQNLVIDNVSSFERDWFVERGRATRSGINNELQDYSAWTNYFNRFMSAIYEAPLNVYVTAWEKQFDYTADNGQKVLQYAPLIRDSVRDFYMGMTDIVGRLMVRDGKRLVLLEGNDQMFAKNRLDNRTYCPADKLFEFGDVTSDS